jgi:hypothetical protein
MKSPVFHKGNIVKSGVICTVCKLGKTVYLAQRYQIINALGSHESFSPTYD